MTTFNDIFKSSFLENITSVSLLDMAVALVLAFGLGLFIFLVYKKTYQGVMYSSSFGVTLVALTMITTVVILAVTSNVVLSLGMVGALSIVRFRTAIKEPLDIAFLFWSIAVGIVLAAGMIPLAVAGSVIIGVILIIFVNKKSHKNPYIVVPQGVTEFDVNPGSDGGKYNMDVESVTLPASLKETDLTFCKNIADITYNCDADHDLIIHTNSFYGTGENNSPRGFTVNFVGLPKSFQVEGSSFDYKIGDTNFGRCWFNTGWDSNSKVIVNLPAGWKEAGFNYPYFTGGTVIYEDGVLVFSNVADTPMP